MSNQEVVSSDKEFIENIRGKKRGFDQNTLIWIMAFVLSFIVFIIGILDWLADYTSERYSGETYTPETGGWVNDPDLANPYYVEIYTSQNGEVATRTLQPIFGQVIHRNPTGGFLPEFITLSVHHWIVLAFIILCGIPAILIYQREGRRLALIDENLPFLLREIADSQRIGMQLPRAISEAAKRNYGPLTPELKKLASKVSWGIPFREAMMAFRNAVDTPMAKQATILILEAERSGGELEKIFDSAKDYVEELLAIKQERESSIKPYIYIVFISYIIFAIVIFVLFTTFFAPFGAQEIVTSDQETVIPVPIHAFKGAFLYLLTAQAFFSGLVAGKMGHGTVKMGLFYSTVLMAIGLLLHIFGILPAVDRIIAEATGAA